MPSNSLILCRPVPFSCLQSFPASGSFLMSSLFATGRQSTRVSASASVLSNEYSGLISLRIDWFDLLIVQGTLKNLLQHHKLNASVFQYSAFILVQLSHLCLTTGKIIALTTWTFAGKVMSLLLNTLSRFVMGFPSGSNSRESACNLGDLGSIPGLGRSHGGWHGNLLQYSCLENPHGQRSLVA